MKIPKKRNKNQRAFYNLQSHFIIVKYLYSHQIHNIIIYILMFGVDKALQTSDMNILQYCAKFAKKT